MQYEEIKNYDDLMDFWKLNCNHQINQFANRVYLMPEDVLLKIACILRLESSTEQVDRVQLAKGIVNHFCNHELDEHKGGKGDTIPNFVFSDDEEKIFDMVGLSLIKLGQMRMDQKDKLQETLGNVIKDLLALYLEINTRKGNDAYRSNGE